MMIDPKITGVSRDKILKALNKEGVPGYQESSH